MYTAFADVFCKSSGQIIGKLLIYCDFLYDIDNRGEKIRFRIRENVKFHFTACISLLTVI